MNDIVAVPWWKDEPLRLKAELAAMELVAPDLVWSEADTGGWVGPLPMWPFDRPRPAGLAALLGHQPCEVLIASNHAYPMVQPTIHPLRPRAPWQMWGLGEYHLLPNGSLCLLQSHAAWNPSARIADMIPKASGWYIEYRLILAGRLRAMPEPGFAAGGHLDHLVPPDPGSGV
jgi:hypothetical protein